MYAYVWGVCVASVGKGICVCVCVCVRVCACVFMRERGRERSVCESLRDQCVICVRVLDLGGVLCVFV